MPEMDKNRKNGLLRTGLIITAFAILLYTFLHTPSVISGIFGRIWSVVSPVVIGMCIAFVLNVALVYIEKLLRLISRGKINHTLSRGLGIVITLVLMFGAVVLILGGILPAFVDMLEQLVSYLPQSADGVEAWILDIAGRLNVPADSAATLVGYVDELANELVEYISSEYLEIANVALGVTTSVLDVIMGFVISLIFAIYILASKEKMGAFCRAAIRRFMNEKRSSRILEVCSLSYSCFTNFVKGQLLEAIILGLLCFVGMLVFGFPYAPVISLLIGVTALIPIMGAWIGAGVSALLILIVSPVEALLFLAFILILQQLEGNLIYPRVVGQSLGLPGLIVLAAVTVGGNIAGIPGMLLGVPACAVGYALAKQAIFGKKEMAEAEE